MCPIEADEPPDTYAAGRDARDKEVETLKEERDEWKRVSGITHGHLLDLGHRLNAVHRQREALERERDRWIEAYEHKCVEREDAHDLADGWKASLLVVLADRDRAWDKNRALERERDELRAAIRRIHDMEPASGANKVAICAECIEPWPCPTVAALDKNTVGVHDASHEESS